MWRDRSGRARGGTTKPYISPGRSGGESLYVSSEAHPFAFRTWLVRVLIDEAVLLFTMQVWHPLLRAHNLMKKATLRRAREPGSLK
jgi:hypothetical protein